ncbi:Autophagy-related protein 22 [Trichoderma cornu-damae]|uniref:Autophagy-related protein n=1 Tax=Trichoderma cornu-damae TaxID=654480 RepID=A0A9P8QJC1_9HYPO|nr:Autophagy-related protein 22 [Trichoderma cornu-damae]
MSAHVLRGEDTKNSSEVNITSGQSVDRQNVDSENPDAPMSTRKALWGWIILCFSTGPTSGMVNTYVSASIQSAANAVGHVPGTNAPCAKRGTIRCVVKLGGGEVDYLSYLLYLRAISRACEGIVSIFTAGAADYSNNRKPMMMASIYLFGVLALPFAGLTGNSYAHLNALSTLYILLTVVSGMYVVIEASYVPIFMRSVGWNKAPRRMDANEANLDQEEYRKAWIKGSRVSVLGLVSSNVGALVALLIGVIITYGRGSYVTEGYFNYLLAITIAGSLTRLLLIRSVRQYPNAFKLCIGWILWNTGYSNFLSLLSALFLEVTGIQRGSGVYTVNSFATVIFACVGSLAWLAAFPYARMHVKVWAYLFLGINILCIFWGCLGINPHVPIGYKYQAEFWVGQFLFMSTSSALRSLNRVLFSSLIPKGSEALYFGLEITLDLATGWINPLVQGVIQNRTHNLRFPMIPDILLMVVALALYMWTDLEKGIRDAERPLETSPLITEP